MSEANNNQKQTLKKYAVFGAMFLAFAVFMWLLFSPFGADDENQKQGMGFNSDIPDPKKGELISDKRDAYMQEQMDQKQKQRMHSLEAFMLGTGTKEESGEIEAVSPVQITEPVGRKTSGNTGNIEKSSAAYQDINRTLGNFYEKPKADPEKDEMKKKLEELEAKMNGKDEKQSVMDEQLVLMEKSYELAAKYMPQGQPAENESLSKRIVKGADNGKTKISPIRQIQNQLVSSLAQGISDEELFQYYDQPHNTGFNTMGGEVGISAKNTISAVIHDDQTVIDGQATRIRLTEPLVAGTTLIPENTILTGMAKIQGERLDIQISSIEYQGTILAVEMTVYDTDAQRGIHIPGSLELNASKEVVANMGNSVGTSFTMTQSTGAQLASDLSKGAIQGVSTYMQKKIRQVRVTLKSGYRIMLMPKAN